MPRGRTAALLLATVAALSMVAGCRSYTETVSCSMGLVLDEDDDCVPPPPPDGGVAVTSCAELCELVSGWDAEQVGCLRERLGRFGSPPESCLMDITDPAICNECVTEAAATDVQCATAGAICQ